MQEGGREVVCVCVLGQNWMSWNENVGRLLFNDLSRPVDFYFSSSFFKVKPLSVLPDARYPIYVWLSLVGVSIGINARYLLLLSPFRILCVS